MAGITITPNKVTGITIKGSGPIQGSSVNPQQTAPSTILQNPAHVQTYQPAATVSSYQNAAQAAAIQAANVAAAAEAQRQAVLAEIARQKQIAHDAKVAQISTLTTNAKQKLAIGIAGAKPKWNISIKQPGPGGKIIMPKLSAYDKIRLDAYNKAMADANSKTKIGHQNPLQKLWDKTTFGSDRRQSSARAYADKQLNDYINKQVDDYSKKLDKFTKDQAAKKAAIENAKFGSQAEFDAAVASYNKWQDQQIAGFEKSRATITGAQQGYQAASTQPLSSAAATTVGWFNNHIINTTIGHALGDVWKYTLGSGSEHVPSIVTAPGRIINWFGNENTPDRVIQKYGGKTEVRTGTKDNAWVATYNQRNFNIHPVTDKPYDKTAAWAALSSKKLSADITTTQFQRDFNNAKTAAAKDTVAKKYWASQNQAARNQNSAKEITADPLNFVSAALKLAKAPKAVELARAGKAGSFVKNVVNVADKVNDIKTATISKITSNPAINWLTSVTKSPGEKLADARSFFDTTQSGAQATFFDRINTLNKKIVGSGGTRLDTTVFDDIKNLTDSEAKILQRTVDGKLAAVDRLRLAGRGLAPVREKLETVAQKWNDFSEQLRSADNVTKTRFGGKKRLYSPNSWYGQSGDDLSKYDFYKQKKDLRGQSADDFHRGAIERYFKSNLDEVHATGQTAKVSRWKAERDRLLQRYDESTAPARRLVDAAEKKATSPLSKVLRIAGFPNRVWKNSVLKFSPSWSVNNAIYNAGAAGLAGGRAGLTEQIKMVNPRYWRKAMDEDRRKFGGNLGREFDRGKRLSIKLPDKKVARYDKASAWGPKQRSIDVNGNPIFDRTKRSIGLPSTRKLDRFYNGLEDWSRVAAGRGAMRNGATADEALKRVNKYFGDYKIRNWERPIKAVVPFYSFQKTIAKAAINMPLDRPGAAIGLHRLDQYQHQQYDDEFQKIVPDLKRLGYTDAEIAGIKADNAKYFAGRLKVGNKWITTPFNAFSEQKFDGVSINPYLAAAGETATGKDRFGTQLTGANSTWENRLVSKFPQAAIVQKGWQALQVANGNSQPKQSWIADPGSDGYGLPKQKQGSNPNAADYDRDLDPRAKLGQTVAAFFGVPRSLEFDAQGIIKAKTLQKLTADYFAQDWAGMDYETEQKKKAELFKKYGVTEDDFYRGVLSKYDNPESIKIKNLKNAAADSNKDLFAQYEMQPVGTRNMWATQKLRELNAAGYFDKNPFLKSFSWINPGTVAKADKQAAYSYHARTAFEYNGKFFKSQASLDRFKANDTRERFSVDGKFFKSAASRDAYISYNSPKNQFWREYFAAPAADRKTLLAAHPQFNDRASWTETDWQAYNATKKAQQKAKIATWHGGDTLTAINQHIAEQLLKSDEFTTIRTSKHRVPSVKWAMKA